MLRCFILSLLFLTNNFQLLLGDSSDPVEKILGNKAAPYSRPWMGQLFYSGRFTCGCSLISNQYALTAAHCVRNDDGRALQRYHIVFGGHSLKSGTSVGIKKIIKHPKYDDVAYYNAALLLLDEIVHETDKISIIRLAEKSPNVNDKCIVNGWGITDKTKLPSKVLKEINVNVTSPRICSDKNSILFDNNTMICVSESKNAGTCSGDDGGPLVCSNNTEYYEQHGIVSFGLSGCRTGITVYTDVSKILPWIYDQVESTITHQLPGATNITEDFVKQTLKNFDLLLSKLNRTNWTNNENQLTLLHVASKNGYYNASEALINKDPSLVNATDKHHWYPLHYAAWNGHCDIVSLLVENGANVNALAIFDDDDSTTPPHLSALHFAASEGHVECVKILLDNGADITHQTNKGYTALHIASREGQFEAAKALIIKDPSLVNVTSKHRQTPLHYAAFSGHCKIVKLLVEDGANPNALAMFDNNNSTNLPSVPALYWAARKGHIECVRILLDKGADINHQTNDEYTALHVASQEGNYDVAKLLIERGADVNNQNNKGFTALHYASRYGRYEVVKLLIESRADVNIKNIDNKTALQLAKDAERNDELIRYLEEKTPSS